MPAGKRIVANWTEEDWRLFVASMLYTEQEGLITLLDLLQLQKIKPIIAQRFPVAKARQAQELLGKGGVVGKIVLVPYHN